MPERTNPDEIEHFGNIPVLGILPWLKDLDFNTCKPGSLLSEFMERVNIDPLLQNDDDSFL